MFGDDEHETENPWKPPMPAPNAPAEVVTVTPPRKVELVHGELIQAREILSGLGTAKDVDHDAVTEQRKVVKALEEEFIASKKYEWENQR